MYMILCLLYIHLHQLSNYTHTILCISSPKLTFPLLQPNPYLTLPSLCSKMVIWAPLLPHLISKIRSWASSTPLYYTHLRPPEVREWVPQPPSTLLALPSILLPPEASGEGVGTSVILHTPHPPIHPPPPPDHTPRWNRVPLPSPHTIDGLPTLPSTPSSDRCKWPQQPNLWWKGRPSEATSGNLQHIFFPKNSFFNFLCTSLFNVFRCCIIISTYSLVSVCRIAPAFAIVGVNHNCFLQFLQSPSRVRFVSIFF